MSAWDQMFGRVSTRFLAAAGHVAAQGRNLLERGLDAHDAVSIRLGFAGPRNFIINWITLSSWHSAPSWEPKSGLVVTMTGQKYKLTMADLAWLLVH